MASNEISLPIDGSAHHAIERLLSDHNTRNKIEAWQELLQQLRDIPNSSQQSLGAAVLKHLAWHNLNCKGKRGRYNKINRPVIDFLKVYFRWPENELDYRQRVGDDKLSDVIFGCNENSSRAAEAEQKQQAAEQKLEQNMKKNWESISPSLVICGSIGIYIAYRLLRAFFVAYFIGG